MRYVLRALLAGGLGFAVSLIAACGGGAGLLSAGQASTLNSQLDQVSSALNAGDCATVTNASQNLTDAVTNLSGSINPTLRGDLSRGAATVVDLATNQCHQATSTTKSTPTISTSSPTSTTTPHTTTSQTSTSSTQTTPTSTGTSSSSATTTTSSGTGTTTGGSGGAGLGGGNGSGQSGGAGPSNSNGQP